MLIWSSYRICIIPVINTSDSNQRPYLKLLLTSALGDLITSGRLRQIAVYTGY